MEWLQHCAAFFPLRGENLTGLMAVITEPQNGMGQDSRDISEFLGWGRTRGCVKTQGYLVIPGIAQLSRDGARPRDMSGLGHVSVYL